MEDKEFTERYTIHRMAEQEIVAAFDCGDEDLNGFILTDAPLYRKEKLAVTYTVFEKSNHNHIVAFFSLSNDRISISLPSRVLGRAKRAEFERDSLGGNN